MTVRGLRPLTALLPSIIITRGTRQERTLLYTSMHGVYEPELIILVYINILVK